MKNSYIFQTLRRALLHRLIFPLLLLTVSGALFFSSRSGGPGLRPVSVRTGELSYTGCDYKAGGTVRGHYYFTLEDGKCRFYILPQKRGRAPQTTVKAGIFHGLPYEMDDQEYSSLLEHMASDIGWTEKGMASVSSPEALSAIFRPEYLSLLLPPAAAVCLLISLADVLLTLRLLLFPLRSPAFRYLGGAGDIEALIPRIEMEMKHTRLAKTGGLTLTPNYLVSLDTARPMILPLESVRHVFRQGRIRKIAGFVFRRARIKSSLCVVTDGKNIFEFPQDSREEIETFLLALERRRPGITLIHPED